MPVTGPAEGALLDRRTLNRAFLARQLLLERVELPAPDAIEHLVGLQAQVPTDPYVALWSRLRAFDPEVLGRLMLGRAVVRMTLMRTTLHLVTARDALALRLVMQPVVERGFASSPFRPRLEGIDLEELLALGARLVEERPRTTSELGRLLAERWPERDPGSLAYAVRYLVPLVQVTPRGVWGRSAAPRVTTLSAWLGTAPDRDAAPDEAAPDEAAPDEAAPDEAVLRYLRSFGPATVADIRTWSWLGGLREVIDRLRPRLRTYRDEKGRELLDVADGRFADPDVPAPVRFLPEYDNAFLSHADRSRITGDLSWGAAFARRGTFFVDGFLAGAWRHRSDRARSVLELEPMRPLAAVDREAVAAEGHALLGFLAADTAVREVAWQAT